jgi:hypothetical protein
MKKTSIWAIIISLVVIAGCVLFIFSRQRAKPAAVKPAANKSSEVQKKTNKADKTKDQYSTDEWMLMGYMAYAHDNYVESRHIKGTADLVTDVGQDLSTGALKAEKTGTNSYHLTNKFGSVDVDVETADVKVSGDGSTFTAKSELKNAFKPYADQIKKMTKNINNGDGAE